MRRNSGIIGGTRTPTIINAPGMHDTFDQYNSKLTNTWPIIPKYFDIAFAGGVSLNEGTTFNISLSTSDVPNGTTLFFTIEQVGGTVNSSDFTDGLLSGSFTINSNSGTFSKTLTLDETSEPGDSFVIRIRTDSTVGPIVISTGTITILNPTFSITPNVTSVNEGSTVTFTVNTTNFSLTTLFWTLENVSNWEASDQSAITGSVTLSGGSGSFAITPIADGFTEGPEVFLARVRLNSTSGPIVATSSNITINDTSTGTPEPSELYAFTTVTFGAGTTANIGPTLAQVQAAMTGTPTPSAWNTSAANLVVNTGIILWTVPATATYRITAEGASGQPPGSTNRGASIRGDFALTQGQKLRIVVGQVPTGTAGGGGSYVVRETGSTNSDIFVIAGGGGGKGSGAGGTATTANSSNTVSNGNGGIGTSASWGGPSGGGFFSSGTVNTGSQPGGSPGSGFLQGSAGGSGGAGSGGFGGGGAGGADSAAGGGAGGGYSGGSSGGDGSSGQGAGSYPNGANQINTANSRSGAGQVIITRL
jgi:hypothetical protein